MLLGLSLVALPGGDAGLRVFPAEGPQIFVGILNLGLRSAVVVAILVPVVRGIEIAILQVNSCGLVGCSCRAVKVVGGNL